MIEVPDTTPPEAALSSISGPTDGRYSVEVTFTETIVGFEAADLVLTNASATLSGAEAAYVITLTPLAEGAFTVALPADAVQDLAGNGNLAAAPVEAIHDVTPPRVTVRELTGPVEGVYTLRLVFSEAISGLDPSMIEISNATVSVTGGGTEYLLRITPEGEGRIILTLPPEIVTDLAGNGNLGAALVDLMPIITRPSVLLSSATTEIVSRAEFTVTAVFSEPVSDLTLGEIAVSGGAAIALSGSGASYAITLRPTGVGDVVVSIPADAAQSAPGAGNLASEPLVIGNRVIGVTQERIATFLLRRADALLASQPDLIARLRGNTSGAFDLASRGTDGSLAFRHSWASGIWADVQGRWDRDGVRRSDYLFGVVGADFIATERLLVGAMLQFDRMDDTDASGFVRGQGWLAGPYVAGQIGEHPLFFEARLLYGATRNSLSIDGGATVSRFDTRRWLGSVRLAGEVIRGPLTFTPSVAISHTTDRQGSFVDGYGNLIGAQSVSLLQGELGLDVSRRFTLSGGDLSVNGGGSVVFSDGGQANAASTRPVADARGRLWLGLGYTSSRGMSYSGDLRLDGLGTGTLTPQVGFTWRYEF